MSKNETKFVLTGIVWLAFTLIMVAGLATAKSPGGAPLLLLILISTVAAPTATQFIWKRASSPYAEAGEESERRTRLDHRLEGMDNAALEELCIRLMTASDGKLISKTEDHRADTFDSPIRGMMHE